MSSHKEFQQHGLTRKLTRTSVLHSQSIPSLFPFYYHMKPDSKNNVLPGLFHNWHTYSWLWFRRSSPSCWHPQAFCFPSSRFLSQPLLCLCGKRHLVLHRMLVSCSPQFVLCFVLLVGGGHWGQENDTPESSGTLDTFFMFRVFSSPPLLTVKGEQLD